MSATSDYQQITPSVRRIITALVMLVAVIEVLDMTIVTVSLPAMMGSLGANSDQVTWILTSYITAAAIAMPLTGILVTRLGRKRLLMINIIGFLVASALCGVSQNLTEMVFFRICQGLFGAGLVPLAQYILRDTYPPAEHGKAMAIWGIGIMVAPVLGPTLGGYITELLSWRWIFYINIPVCAVALLLALRFIKESATQNNPIDWLGVMLLAIAVASLQVFLDRGASEDWFQSKLIVVLACSCLISFLLFIQRSRQHKHPVINFSLFNDKNFVTGLLGIGLFCATMVAVVSLQPMLLEQLMGYPTIDTGEMMAPRGLASALAMLCVMPLLKRYSPQRLMVVGLLLALTGTLLMTQFVIQSPPSQIMIYGVFQGIGMGLFFVPISTLAFVTLPKEQTAAATGLFSFARSLGISVGISLMSTTISHQSQQHWHILSAHVQPYNPSYTFWQAQHASVSQAVQLKHLSQQLGQQAGLLAFIDSYWFAAGGLLLLMMMVLIRQRPH